MPKRQILKMKDPAEGYYTAKEDIFDLPFRLLIVGKSQLSGKTNLVCNLMLDPRKDFYRGDFNGEDVFVVSPSSKTDHKLKVLLEQLDVPDSNVIKSYDEGILEVVYDMLEKDYLQAVEEKRKPSNKLVIFDDMSYGGALKNKTHGIIAKLFSNGRHLNISTIVTAQKYSDILTSARENATGLILFSCTDKQLDLIAEDHNYLQPSRLSSKKRFRAMFRKVTNPKHSFLVVNYSNDPHQRYMDSSFKPICVCPEGKEGSCGNK